MQRALWNASLSILTTFHNVNTSWTMHRLLMHCCWPVRACWSKWPSIGFLCSFGLIFVIFLFCLQFFMPINVIRQKLHDQLPFYAQVVYCCFLSVPIFIVWSPWIIVQLSYLFLICPFFFVHIKLSFEVDFYLLIKQDRWYFCILFLLLRGEGKLEGRNLCNTWLWLRLLP